ncbi:hypothetical protein FRB94_000556 [Tulasnella sp. JGI-2019a]|nr:hypothetical protein FRB94_000556 [Tulasnella sp. JGI-2019a]KAG9016150.1 hypothetical protein FRB93_011624 [Tulasnella sp. JGI-2019a]KAG9032957.1 hypothetical protein FRB95_000705 [Tulasnella sp. JGI-2019a]
MLPSSPRPNRSNGPQIRGNPSPFTQSPAYRPTPPTRAHYLNSQIGQSTVGSRLPLAAFMHTVSAVAQRPWSASVPDTLSPPAPPKRNDRRIFESEKDLEGLGSMQKTEKSRFSFDSVKTSPSTSGLSSRSGKIALSADPESWEINPGTPGFSSDDWLHNPDPRRDRKNDRGATIFSRRGIANLGCLSILISGILFLFIGFPILNRFKITQSLSLSTSTFAGINSNSSGQVPVMNGNFGLIDRDTPVAAYTTTSYQDGSELQLVFSDEFNVDNRTFYPGDDPYWEAEDLYYWQTGNLNWYDPDTITTKDGSLVITLSQQESHGLQYQGGLISSWNKFCFTGGLLEVSAVLPGASDIQGLWPAIWSMGNLGRMGYGASLEGMWPYTYDSCDVGTLPNQTFPDGTPVANTQGNDPANSGALSYLPGQRLSACTCSGEDHPGPKAADGSFVGRGAPEIDVLEATVDGRTLTGKVSQSAQWAPYNSQYIPSVSNQTLTILEPSIVEVNSYVGGVFQQTTSALADTNSDCGYEASGANACFQTYGFEYQPGNNGYITWISSGRASWTISAEAMKADPVSGASQRPVSEEPMCVSGSFKSIVHYLMLFLLGSVIANLALSPSFGFIDFAHLQFPARMHIDYVRVYQPKDKINIGCNPSAFPTESYIENHIEAYTNANLTTWKQYGATFPKNRLLTTC